MMQRTTTELFVFCKHVRCLTGDSWQTCALGRCAACLFLSLKAILGQPCVSRWSSSQEQISTRTATLQPSSSLWRQPLDFSQCERPEDGGHPAAGGYSPVCCGCGLPAAFVFLVSQPQAAPQRLSHFRWICHTQEQKAGLVFSYEVPPVILISCLLGQ